MITSGTLLIQGDAPRPGCFEVDADSHADAWMSIKHALTPRQLEKELSATGWTFFFMASRIRAMAFGFNRDNMVGAALNRCIKIVKQQRCNCLEVESAEMHSFLGIPYVILSVRPRHIQKGMVFARRPLGDSADISAPEIRCNVAVT